MDDIVIVEYDPCWSQQFEAEEAQRYATLKRNLAERFKTDCEAYTLAKADYIQAVMAKARLFYKLS